MVSSQPPIRWAAIGLRLHLPDMFWFAKPGRPCNRLRRVTGCRIPWHRMPAGSRRGEGGGRVGEDIATEQYVVASTPRSLSDMFLSRPH